MDGLASALDDVSARRPDNRDPDFGRLTVGASPAEAFLRMHYLNQACEIQVAAQSGGVPLRSPSDTVCERTAAQFRGGVAGDVQTDPATDLALVWAALRRLLDRVSPGYDN